MANARHTSTFDLTGKSAVVVGAAEHSVEPVLLRSEAI
jgi:hypothetical protein